MQLQLTITADTAKELNDAIIDLALRLPTKEGIAKDVLPRIKKEEAKVEAAETKPEKESNPEPEDLPAAKPKADDGSHTEASIRALMQEKAQDGKRAEVKALLNKIVGSEKANFKNLEPSKYEEFAKELNKL